MEKILLALEGSRQNVQAVDFACYLARLTGSRLTGAFLEKADAGSAVAMAGSGSYSIIQEGTDEIDQFMRKFREACVCRDVPASVHRDRGVPVKEILLESRFSDLLVIDPEASFEKEETIVPGHFLKEVMERAECPVIASPFGFAPIEEIVFAYDGSPSSVFAIKQFTYLFPRCWKSKAVVVTVRRNEADDIAVHDKIREWCSIHYDHVEYEVLTGEAPDQLFSYLLDRKGCVAVLGAYGRGLLSRFLRPSTARLLLKTLNIPVFIAHC